MGLLFVTSQASQVAACEIMVRLAMTTLVRPDKRGKNQLKKIKAIDQRQNVDPYLPPQDNSNLIRPPFTSYHHYWWQLPLAVGRAQGAIGASKTASRAWLKARSSSSWSATLVFSVASGQTRAPFGICAYRQAVITWRTSRRINPEGISSPGM
ncbi:hypothetical protein VTI74DRAFT_1258 [Chaetomium olivicolor]